MNPDTDQPEVARANLYLIGAWIWIIGLAVTLLLVAHALNSHNQRIDALEKRQEQTK